MRITPESLRYFAQSVHLTLETTNVQPRNVLLRRLRHTRPPFPATRRLLSLEASLSSSYPAPPAADSTAIPSRELNHWSVVETQSSPETPRTSQAVNTQYSALLPQSCPGCGALSQELEQGEAGYYSRSRKAVKHYLKTRRKISAGKRATDDEVSSASPSGLPSEAGFARSNEDDGLPTLSHDLEVQNLAGQINQPPICDRCHDLLYQSRGVSIAHPPIDAIADSIAESPFRHNHIYHVLDAADFPLSLIPNIHKSLALGKPRSQNRRSQHDFSRKPTLSFIITRGDLVAKTKESIEKLMPYFTSVLRTALGSLGANMRLGNVHLVSAKRGWWTRGIKDAIWKRGGGNWMVGKANVGKSNLFEVLFPKGSGERAPSYAQLQQDGQEAVEAFQELHGLPENSLLPPLQPETPFPVLPLVSSLPGTTASPIRLSFGKHKGELIDLPGLARGGLEDYVHPDHRNDLIMQTRPTVSQHNIKSGQSLLLGGGLVRITPKLDENDPSTVVLAYAFVPIDAHVTATSKAIATQFQERESGIKSILGEGVGGQMASAGVLTLSDDVTKARAAPLLASGVTLSKLPFRVFATDILIEGVGWVELVCQVRKRRQSRDTVFVPTSDGDALSHLDGGEASGADDRFPSFDLPQVEVFTPAGKYIGQRKTMQAWKLWQDTQRLSQRKRSVQVRPRKPMKGSKKREKAARKSLQSQVLVK